jgi:hypothetical protein
MAGHEGAAATRRPPSYRLERQAHDGLPQGAAAGRLAGRRVRISRRRLSGMAGTTGLPVARSVVCRGRSRTPGLGTIPVLMSARNESRRKRMPRLAATSPTASNARSSLTISNVSPGRATPSQQPASVAILRSLQSFTPETGALCTSSAPARANRCAVSRLTTRQFPTATSRDFPPSGRPRYASVPAT